MIEIIQEYWQSYLWFDGYQLSGVAMTLWLLVVSIAVKVRVWAGRSASAEPVSQPTSRAGQPSGSGS